MPPAAAEKSLGTVVVTATRSSQPSFALPVSIDSVGQRAIQQEHALANLSDALARVPGIVAQNRQNYAQDLQISSRGFGARSTFGVRGVRLYVDGVPATMPDGQGQTSHIDLSSAARIEALRGPFSALYGNSSGGVISVFTENGRPGLAVSPFVQFGSYATHEEGIKAAGQQGMANYVLSVTRFDTGGYRQHSAASRATGNAKLRLTLDADAALTVVANAVRMPDVQDPLGLTRAQFEADPRSADPSASLFNTRKSIDQQQLGLDYTKYLSRQDSIRATVYAGHRATLQFQAIPVAAQLPPTSAGGVIDLARRYGGVDLRWTREHDDWQWTVGVALDNLNEDRRGYENFIDGTLGVQGRLRRDEANNVHNIDQYLQAQWKPAARWLLLAGVRNSTVHVQSEDHFISAGNGDDSGSTQYHALNPVLGATFGLSESVNLYAAYGRGFETPTLNELSYRPGGAPGLNFALQPSRSRHVEAGIKVAFAQSLRVNVAAFHIDTDNELAVLSNTGGRAVYQNAGKTKRDGIELALERNWDNGAALLLSYSLLRAVYANGFCNGPCTPATQVDPGNRIPGVPDRTLYAELSWWPPASGFSAALEGRHVGKVYVDDANSDAAAGYVVAAVRAGFEQRHGRWTVRELLRIDNLAGRRYAGSVIVNESSRRFFEPAPQRNYLAGITAVYQWR